MTGATPQPITEPTARQRVAWMGKNSKRLIIALVVLIIAALVVIFSFSLFSSSSANPGNLVTTGSMELNNSAEDSAIYTVEGLLPGESGSGTVTITNVGESDGNFTLTPSNLVDTPATPPLSSVVTLVVTDGADEVYNGLLSGMTAPISLGTWAGDETHTYTFTVTFASEAGNEFQGASSTLDFTWAATS